MEHPSLSPETTDLAAGRQRDILHAVLDAPTLDALAGLAQQAHAQQIAGELADTIIKTLKPGLAVFGFGGLFGERFTPAQRANALHMIRLLAEPVQLEPLIRCLFDRSADVRYAAAWALSSMAMWLEWGTPEIQQAIRALIGAARHREDREVRLMAVKTLGRISAWEAKDALVQRLDDEQDDEIRTEVALALGRLKHADAVYDLMSAYEAGEIDAQVCMTAVLRLDNDAIEPLISVLSRWNVRLVSRILAADALTRLNAQDAVEQMVIILERPHEPEEMRLAVAEALGALGDATALPALERVAQQEVLPPTLARTIDDAMLALRGDDQRRLM